MDVAPTVVPEPGHARPEGAVPDRAGARRAPAAPARAAAARAGPVGAGRRPRAERVPGGGARGAPAVGALPRPAPAAAGVAAGRGGQGRPLRRAGRRRALLRAPAAVGAGLVARARAGAGGRRHRPPRGRGGAGGQRALPRLGHPGRLGGAARQRAGAVAGRHPPLAAPAAAGRAAGLDGAGAGRPGPVEPAPLAAHPPARLAPAAARPAADHDRARRAGALPGRGPGPARRGLVRPGEAWVGRGRLGRPKGRRLTVTLVAVWTAAQEEPWVVVTDLPPDRVGGGWYALRAGGELGFRALKGLGWQWQRSRRTDPARVARHWLVLAVASLAALAHGTRVEAPRGRGLPPARLRAPPASRAGTRPRPRRISLVRLGIQWLRHLLAHGRLWRPLWPAPEPWPQPPPGLAITVHGQGA